VDDYPVLHVTAVTQRREPIYPATLVGRPPMEDYWMGKATERLFLPLMKLFLSEIVDVHMPAEGVFHNLVLVSIKKRFPGHPRKVINGLWGLAFGPIAHGRDRNESTLFFTAGIAEESHGLLGKITVGH
jgi:4-hydroxy-3-polyprenylbenzoate decarboxylase